MSAPSLAGQTVEQLGGRRSVLARQRADHQELDRLLHELDGATGTEQLRVLRAVDRLVFTHAFAEESVLWPVIRRVLPDGEALTLEIEVEHLRDGRYPAELFATLQLEGLMGDDEEYWPFEGEYWSDEYENYK